MTFNDIFKSSFLDNMTSVSYLDMALALTLAFCVGLFIFFVYKKTYQGVMYSSSFGVTLVALTMITTLVILAVTSNVVLSLGMVGALSIVRFRTAIKEPLDIAFLFWSIAAGIVLAAAPITAAPAAAAPITAAPADFRTSARPRAVPASAASTVAAAKPNRKKQAPCSNMNKAPVFCGQIA